MSSRFFRIFFIEELLALALAIIATIINIVGYENTPSVRDTIFLMARYFTFDYPFYNFFFLFVYLFYFLKFYVRLASKVRNRIVYKIAFPQGSGRELISHFFSPIRLLAPLVIPAVPVYTLLANFNYELRFSGKDLLFLRADEYIFGSIPFLSLPAVFSSDFAVALFQYGYFSLGIVMSLTLALLFLLGSKFHFRQAILSFLLSLLLTFPLFYLFPCQDPNNYFLRNVRQNSIPEDTSYAISRYHPSQLTKNIIEKIARAETNELADNNVPVSCFPSMHAVWAFFVIYFLFVLARWSLFFTILWTAFLLAGGVYFAQHYVIDYIAAIPAAALSLWIASLLLRWEAKIKNY